MKDPKGHGSNGRETGSQTMFRRAMSAAKQRDAADVELAAKNKHAPDAVLGVHDTTYHGVGPNSPLAGSRDYDPMGNPRSDDSKSSYDEYNRDLSHRARNGGIGSGGRR